MANRYRNLIYSTAEYTHSYRGFRGVELSASEVTTSQSRLAYSQNMYKNYDADGAEVLESVPGFRCFAHYGKAVHALYYQRSPSGKGDHLLVHVGDKIMRHPLTDTDRSNCTGQSIATVRDGKSFGFEYGKHYFIMDTEKLLRVSDDGTSSTVSDDGAKPYTPTIYVSGEEYEQRNLLTDRFKEDYYVADPSVYLYSSSGLEFAVIDPNLGYCSVVGIKNATGDEIYIPAYVDINGGKHKVISIAESAFSGNTSIKAVYMPEGIITVGKNAFLGCTSLHTAVTSSTVVRIESGTFSGCTALSKLYLGASLSYIGSEALKSCNNLTTVDYALGASELDEVEGSSTVKARGVRYSSKHTAIRISLPLHEKVDSINGVTVDKVAHAWSVEENSKEDKSVVLNFSDSTDATDVEITIEGVLTPLDEDWAADMNSLASVTPQSAIVNCRTAEVFDGRIFFSGNPDFPNTVFYTERARKNEDGALYVGRYNYFNDGVGSYKVKSLLAVRDMLAVFKEGDDGSGSIFYHKKEAVSLGAIDTVYPVAYVHSGICSSGTCLSFLDDPVFLTDEGLMALNHENINYQRNVVCRSHNVNYSLLKEDLSNAALCEWLGYLAIGINGKIFLADSRAVFSHPAGSYEYEWFMLTDVGAYTGDSVVYRYSSDSYADATAHPILAGEVADAKQVYSQSDSNGVTYYYTYDGAAKRLVVPTEERSGGQFFPANVFTSHGKLLFFATDDGHVCVFNNDKLGVAPESVKSSADYDEYAYRAAMGNKIHPYFYSFAGHAPTYVLKTALDDCGVPHLTKSTVKRSLVIKAKSATRDAICCEVKTDEREPVYIGSFPGAISGFDDFDFTEAPWYTGRYASVALPENEKKWIEKQITLSASAYASPISVYTVSYRYTIKGKIKNNA